MIEIILYTLLLYFFHRVHKNYNAANLDALLKVLGHCGYEI